MKSTGKYSFIFWVIMVAMIGLAIAGCGSSNNSNTGTPTASPVTTDTPTPTAKVSILSENFDNAATDTFFTPAYKALSSDSGISMYYKTAGTVAIESGALVLGPVSGGRFTIGNKTPATQTTSTDTTTTGELNLSKAYKISFKVVGTSGDQAKKFQIYVDNNTSKAASSMLGNNSLVYTPLLSELTAGQTVTVEPTVGSSSSFIQLRVETDGCITIDDLVIEYK